MSWTAIVYWGLGFLFGLPIYNGLIHFKYVQRVNLCLNTVTQPVLGKLGWQFSFQKWDLSLLSGANNLSNINVKMYIIDTKSHCLRICLKLD